MSSAKGLLMSSRNVKICARENGTNFCLKTWNIKKRYQDMNLSSRDKENNSKALSTKTKENYLKQTELSRGFNIKKINVQQQNT